MRTATKKTYTRLHVSKGQESGLDDPVVWFFIPIYEVDDNGPMRGRGGLRNARERFDNDAAVSHSDYEIGCNMARDRFGEIASHLPSFPGRGHGSDTEADRTGWQKGDAGEFGE